MDIKDYIVLTDIRNLATDRTCKTCKHSSMGFGFIREKCNLNGCFVCDGCGNREIIFTCMGEE